MSITSGVSACRRRATSMARLMSSRTPRPSRNGKPNTARSCAVATSSYSTITTRQDMRTPTRSRACRSASPRVYVASTWHHTGQTSRRGGDVSDWLVLGHTREELDALIAQAPDYQTDAGEAATTNEPLALADWLSR